MHLPTRLKRLRTTPQVRDLFREHHLQLSQLIAPVFISELHQEPQEIKSMPGIFQIPLNALAAEIDELWSLGIQAVLLFGLPSHKDAEGSAACESLGIIQNAIRLIKKSHPSMLVIADLCLCEYTDHGHCGILVNKAIDNDATLGQLASIAVSYAAAGVDWVAPSSMTDGMVKAIRTALDDNEYKDVAILSYAVKYSSCFYGPFREAALGAPQFGDRKTYQMDSANAREAIREAQLDVDEGADMLMVKPAIHYLDIIQRVKAQFPEIPLGAYHVSGEYAMIKAAAKAGVLNEEEAIWESLIAIKRAGADFIITYFAKQFAAMMRKSS